MTENQPYRDQSGPLTDLQGTAYDGIYKYNYNYQELKTETSGSVNLVW